MSDIITKIKPISTFTLVDSVEMSLMEFISRDDVKPGDPVPREVDLSKTLGVSRTVIREALTRLRILGLIKSKKHKGMIVTKPDVLSGFEKVLIPGIMDENTLKDIFELRIVLEMGMAELLFARKTKDDIDELENILQMEKARPANHFEIEEELRFHGKLYQICGNDTLKRFQRILLPIFQFVNSSEIFEPVVITKSYVSHKGLVQVLKYGTPEAFRSAMSKHLEPHFVRIFPIEDEHE